MAGLDFPGKLRRGLGDGQIVAADVIKKKLLPFDRDNDGCVTEPELAAFLQKHGCGGPWFCKMLTQMVWKGASDWAQKQVEMLKVEHVIVCGHYGCGGVTSALEPHELGLIDNWLRHIKDVYSKYERQLTPLPAPKRVDRLCELNVIEQVYNVCHTTIAQQAWRTGQPLSVHGWIYSLEEGLLKDLNVTVDAQEDIEPIYRTAIEPA